MPLSHDEVKARLRGQTLRIPNLEPILSAWPAAARNPNYGVVKPAIQATLQDNGYEARLKDDLTLLTSLIYPQASPERLKDLSLYMVWLVCWDDDVDSGEGELGTSFEKAETWREQTLEAIRESLLGEKTLSREVSEQGYLHSLIRNFMSTIRAGEQGYNETQRRRLYTEIQSFVNTCSDEQLTRLRKVALNYDDYMHMRVGTVAGGTLCALVEYAMPQPSPRLPDSPARRLFEEQVSVLISLINDLLSLKKELKTDCVVNVAATLLTADNNLDDVVTEVRTLMETAVEVFDRAAATFLQDIAEDDMVMAAKAYIAGCRAIVTGVLEFTLVSPRYNLAKMLAQDGSLELVL